LLRKLQGYDYDRATGTLSCYFNGSCEQQKIIDGLQGEIAKYNQVPGPIVWSPEVEFAYCPRISLTLGNGGLARTLTYTTDVEKPKVSTKRQDISIRVEWYEARHSGKFTLKFKQPIQLESFIQGPKGDLLRCTESQRSKNNKEWEVHRVPDSWDEYDVMECFKELMPGELLNAYPRLKEIDLNRFLITVFSDELDYQQLFQSNEMKNVLLAMSEEMVRARLMQVFPRCDKLSIRRRGPAIIQQMRMKRIADIFYGSLDDFLDDVTKSSDIENGKINVREGCTLRLLMHLSETYEVPIGLRDQIKNVMGIIKSSMNPDIESLEESVLSLSLRNDEIEIKSTQPKAFAEVRRTVRDVLIGRRIDVLERLIPALKGSTGIMKTINSELSRSETMLLSRGEEGELLIHSEAIDPLSMIPKWEKIFKSLISTSPLRECAICMGSSRLAYKLTSCGHEFCLSCVHEMLVHSLQELPIRCPIPTCLKDISLFDIHQLLSPSRLNQLKHSALRGLIANNQHRWGHCPKPECNGVYEVPEEEAKGSEEEMQIFNLTACLSCEVPICSKCRVLDHHGLTCQQFERIRKADEDMNLLLSKDGGQMRRCPECKVVLEKGAGCNHVQCKLCKYHICWFQGCMKTFKEEHACYNHMKEVHGNYYDDIPSPVWSDVDEDDIDEHIIVRDEFDEIMIVTDDFEDDY
jgi:hypothetical protein